MGEQGLNRGQKGQCSPHSAHLAPSPHKASSRETSRANKGFLSSQAFPLGRALTKAVPAAAGEKGRENELILDEKEPHPFASCASAIPRAGHTEQGWVGRQGQQRLQDTAMPLSCHILLQTQLLPQEFVLLSALQAAAAWLQRPDSVRAAGENKEKS